MRVQRNGDYTTVWASADDTYRWAHREGAAWPCSTLADRRLRAEFQRGDLVDLDFNGGRGDQDCDAHEFNAFCDDIISGTFR